MIALIALLALAASSALAQNPGSVLMPYSLFGNFTGNQYVSGGEVCAVTFEANATGAIWIESCGVNATAPQTKRSVSLLAPSVVACGQNQQLGMTYGVFGGVLTGGDAPAPACVYYTRVDPLHQYGDSKNAFANLTVYTPTTVNGSSVSCQATFPGNKFEAPELPFSLTQFYICSSGVCQTDVQSSYCDDASLRSVYQIGIGMGIGGIGLLVSTFSLILIISSLVQG